MGMYLSDHRQSNKIGVGVWITLMAILTCMLILVFQSFREPAQLGYTVQIEDARDPNGGHTEAENCINLYGPTTIFVQHAYDIPLDEDEEE